MSEGDDPLRQATRRLKEAGVDAAELDARHLLAHVTGRKPSSVGRFSKIRMSQEQAKEFDALLLRRAAREPLQRLIGRWDFWTLELEMGEAGLVPRQDSETLIETLLANRAERGRAYRMLDLGTGTGCLLLAALSEYPQATGLGVDLSPEAVALASRNAQLNGLSLRADFQQGDWGDGLAGGFDVVLSNPPYIASAEIACLSLEVARHDPRLALDGGADGLDAYRRIAGQLPRLLAPGGLAVIELGQGQEASVAELLRAAGLKPCGVRKDAGGVPRAIFAEIA